MEDKLKKKIIKCFEEDFNGVQFDEYAFKVQCYEGYQEGYERGLHEAKKSIKGITINKRRRKKAINNSSHNQHIDTTQNTNT